MFDELQKQCELASWWMRRPKKDSMSALWQWSDIIVVCKLCLATVSTSGGNTTNLFNHLKRKHLNMLRVIHSAWYNSHSHRYLKRSRRIRSSWKNMIKGAKDGKRWLRRSLSMMWCHSMLWSAWDLRHWCTPTLVYVYYVICVLLITTRIMFFFLSMFKSESVFCILLQFFVLCFSTFWVLEKSVLFNGYVSCWMLITALFNI